MLIIFFIKVKVSFELLYCDSLYVVANSKYRILKRFEPISVHVNKFTSSMHIAFASYVVSRQYILYMSTHVCCQVCWPILGRERCCSS